MIIVIINRIEIMMLAFAVVLIAFTGNCAVDTFEFIAVSLLVTSIAFGIYTEIDLRRFFRELEERDAEE